MRQIYKNLLTVGVLAAAAMSAKAYDSYNVYLRVDNASLIEVSYWDNKGGEKVYLEVNDGVNVLEDINAYYLSIDPKDGAIFKSISYDQYEWNGNGYGVVKNTDKWSIYPKSINFDSGLEDYQVDVEVGTFAEYATGNITLNVDDPEKVNYGFQPMSMPYGVSTDLVKGSNAIKYIPDAMTKMTVQPKEYNGAPLYEVKLNGEVQKIEYGTQYSLPITDGMVVDVITAYPDEDVTVKFEFLNDGKDAITYVKANGNEVTGWETGEISVKIGSLLEVGFNSTEYASEYGSCKWNDGTAYFPLSQWVLEPSTLLVDATKRPVFTVDVTVNDAEAIVFWKGYSSSGVKVPLVNGENKGIEVPTEEMTDWDHKDENGNYLKYLEARVTIVPADGYVIDEVLYNGVAAEKGYDDSYPIYMHDENNTISITTSKLVRDQEVVFYLQDMDAWKRLRIVNSNWQDTGMDLVQGYNEFLRGKSELEGLILDGSYMQPPYVYINDVLQTEKYYGSPMLGNLVNGDVVKIYNGDEAPATYTVDFTVEEGLENVSIVRDIIKDVNPSESLTCFPGTQVSISSPVALIVKVGETTIEANQAEDNGEVATQADAEYVYTFDVNSNDAVSIAADPNVGFITISSDDAQVEIYNLQGIRINNANLPAGIYIINGKKVVVK